MMNNESQIFYGKRILINPTGDKTKSCMGYLSRVECSNIYFLNKTEMRKTIQILQYFRQHQQVELAALN